MYESYSGEFQYRHHNLYRAAEYPDALLHCRELFDAPEAKLWASSIVGSICDKTIFSASLYLSGDYSLPHDDCVQSQSGCRKVAFIWHLTKGWDARWGGALYWSPTRDYIQPSFNTLYIFRVSAQSVHLVTQVNRKAKAKRLTINGWWLGPETQRDEVSSTTRTYLADGAVQAY
jgi:Rps23 Pro-64 3,4-dihydroxylase Tpa1-like proline 4-hydroxylase